MTPKIQAAEMSHTTPHAIHHSIQITPFLRPHYTKMELAAKTSVESGPCTQATANRRPLSRNRSHSQSTTPGAQSSQHRDVPRHA
jgi:hypothetical protein